MALFKISKGLSKNLMTNVPYAKEGFAYFTSDDGKFYIDIDGDGTNASPAVIGDNRIPLSALSTDWIKATKIEDTKTYPILAFKVADNTKNLIELKYGSIGYKDGTLVIPNVETGSKDEVLIENNDEGSALIIDNKGAGIGIKIINTGKDSLVNNQGININDNIRLNMNGSASFEGDVVIGGTYIFKGGPTEKLEVNGNVKATQFKGNADTADKWKTPRTFTIGTVGKTVDGSSNVSWTLDELGVAAGSHKQAYTSSECIDYTSDEATMGITPAAVKKAFTIFEPKSHNHDSSYVKKTGDTMTGQLAIDKAGYGFRVNNGSTGYIELSRDGYGAQIYGLWDCIKYQWIVQSDGANVSFHGNADSASKTLGDINGLQIDTNYLKLSGGTMSGDITFAQIATWPTPTGETYPIQSKKLKWSGSSNNAEIFYEVAGSDKGVLVLNVGDDADAIISFRSCGVEKGKVTTQGIWGAVWNDYAEFREGDTIDAGRCVIEVGNDTLITSTERMMPGANITSDTFGFAIGETEQAKTPIAVSGRVLAYPYESREEFKKNIGRPVCSGPNGTVSIMTDEEYRDKGYCAIGTISAVPEYEEWGTGKVKVNGRVWIKVF